MTVNRFSASDSKRCYLPSAVIQSQYRHVLRSATAKKEKKVSLLDLAAKILADTGEAMNCKELVAKAKETGWVSRQ